MLEKATTEYKTGLSQKMIKLLDPSNHDGLDGIYADLIQKMVDPFVPPGRSPKTSTRPFWTNELSDLTGKRSALFHKAIRTRQDTDWEAYLNFDRDLKKKSRKSQGEMWSTFKRDLENSNQSTAVGRVSNIMLVRSGRARRCTEALGANVNFSTFSKCVAANFPPKLNEMPLESANLR